MGSAKFNKNLKIFLNLEKKFKFHKKLSNLMTKSKFSDFKMILYPKTISPIFYTLLIQLAKKNFVLFKQRFIIYLPQN